MRCIKGIAPQFSINFLPRHISNVLRFEARVTDYLYQFGEGRSGLLSAVGPKPRS
jgi:hypothetical protein